MPSPGADVVMGRLGMTPLRKDTFIFMQVCVELYTALQAVAIGVAKEFLRIVVVKTNQMFHAVYTRLILASAYKEGRVGRIRAEFTCFGC